MQTRPTIEEMIDGATPLVGRLSAQNRTRLSFLVDLFLEDATFEGADGFQLTPHILVSIATQACFLLVRRREDRFGRRIKILVHEDMIDRQRHLMGRFSPSGLIELNWMDVKRGGFLPNDGCNVVMHEFAHKLDSKNWNVDGVPLLHSPVCHGNWRRIMGEEYERFKAQVDNGEFTPLNPYAATHPAEFFACATEALFEQPKMLREHYPRVFDRLVHFYGDADLET
ncbi:MAG: zinc-dependent peptidase [Hyphomonas sp.]